MAKQCTPARADAFTPDPAALDLWHLELFRAQTEADLALLSHAERAKAERIIIARKTTQSIRARAELRRIVGRYVGRDPAELQFVYGEHDKPSLEPDQQPAHGHLSFNLSHSESAGLVAVTLAERPVDLGVDVEHTRDSRDLVGIAGSFFAPDELETLMAMDEHARTDGFYRAWTCKEAYLKALGTGLSFRSTGFSIAYAPGDELRVLSTTRVGDDPSRWTMRAVPCPSGFAGAVCWDATAVDVARVRRFYGPTSAP